MQDDPQNDELDESQSESSDVDDNDATEISESETEKPNTGDADSNGVEEPPQSLLLGDSLTGDIEAIVASDIFIDEDLASAVLETDGSGGRVAQKSAFTEVNDKGFTIEEVIPDGFISVLSCDADVYLGSLTDDDATMLGTANEFDLDAELEDDIEDAFFPNKEFELDAEPNDIYGSEGCIDFDCDPDASQAVINQETLTVVEDSKPTTAPHLPKRKLWKQVYHYGYLLILFAIAIFILWLGIMERLGIGYLPLPW